jgi:hypothetical protein
LIKVERGIIMPKMSYEESETIAASLYDGGWRASDRAQLIQEYDLTDDEADAICAHLERFAGYRNA